MQTVIKVIVEHLDVAESKVTPEAHLVDDLGADPFDHISCYCRIKLLNSIEFPECLKTEPSTF